MPIKIPDQLPAKEILKNENIFIMDEDRAIHQDIRPLRIAILNLMPTKIVTETQCICLSTDRRDGDLRFQASARPAVTGSPICSNRDVSKFKSITR